jgi:hypothetical protein
MPLFQKIGFSILVTVLIIFLVVIIAAATRSSIWASRHGWTILYGDKEMTTEFYVQCLADGNDPIVFISARDVYKAVCRTSKEDDKCGN